MTVKFKHGSSSLNHQALELYCTEHGEYTCVEMMAGLSNLFVEVMYVAKEVWTYGGLIFRMALEGDDDLRVAALDDLDFLDHELMEVDSPRYSQILNDVRHSHAT